MKYFLLKIFFYIFLIAGIFISKNSVAQTSGVLDSTFDGDGKVLDNWGGCNAIVLQSDGKIVTFGGNGFYLARYNSDGSVDSTFNLTGKVFTGFAPYVGYPKTATLQPDGKIIAAGYCDIGLTYDYAMVRYNTDGSLDSTFDYDGKVVASIGGGQGSEMIKCIGVQSDGKIIAYDWTAFDLVRFDSTGAIDSSYGSNGIAPCIILDESETNAMLIQPDGKVVSVGWASYLYDNPVMAIARHNPDGSLDTTFNNYGTFNTSVIGLFGTAHAVVLQPDGKIIVAGQEDWGSTYLIMRFNTDGTIDSSYGINGIVMDTVGLYDIEPNSMVVQQDGKIIVSGSVQTQPLVHDYIAVRYDTSGNRDATFGVNGLVYDSFTPGWDNLVRASNIQTDGKLILGGTDHMTGIALARYLTDLNVGLVDFTTSKNSTLIYPNPVKENATLEYELKNEEVISIDLLDMQGKLVKTFIENQKQQAGKHQQVINLPDGLASGSYLIVISSPKGKMSIKVIK